eukprot:TRINITY_DN26861_c0_g1_i1.p1 TRINITY_DN26861_c0_g1~~TRINITY_DN26861_c0_g1_i1.p1  ORF type:complete len:229 (+),score=60.78 TRINITY_DN26861_c0_g1_i1:139-825(+)
MCIRDRVSTQSTGSHPSSTHRGSCWVSVVMASKRTKERGDANFIEIKPLLRPKPGQISSSIFDTAALKKYKAFFKLSKMNYQAKEQISAAVARHFAVHAVDEASVLVNFLDEVKRQQEYYFDLGHVAKTQGRNSKSGRSGPGASKTYGSMISHALSKLDGKRGTIDQICEIMARDFQDQLVTGGKMSSGRKRHPTWRNSVMKRLNNMPQFQRSHEDRAKYCFAQNTQK